MTVAFVLVMKLFNISLLIVMSPSFYGETYGLPLIYIRLKPLLICLVRNRLRGVGTKLKGQLLVGASALCSVIWLSRNDVVSDKSPTILRHSLAQILGAATKA